MFVIYFFALLSPNTNTLFNLLLPFNYYKYILYIFAYKQFHDFGNRHLVLLIDYGNFYT